MKIRVLSLLAVMAMLLGLPATPVSAGPADPDVGTFIGVFVVGKTFSIACTDQGDGMVDTSGGGLGFPLLSATKHAVFSAASEPGGVNSLTQGLGELDVCGDLAPWQGIGAACGMSEGLNGQGKIHFDNNTVVQLTNLGWAPSAGSILPVTADAHDITNSGKGRGPNSTLVSIVRADGDHYCLHKRDGSPVPPSTGTPLDNNSPKGDRRGAVHFTVTAVYAIVQ